MNNASKTSIGFSFSTKEMRYVVLTGDGANPEFIEKKIIPYLGGAGIGEALVNIESRISTLLQSESPDIVALRFSINGASTADEVASCFYSQAMLFAEAQRRNIKAELFNLQKLNAKQLGLPRGTDVLGHVDDVLGTHPPYWDKVMKEVCIAAWLGLKGL